jgi:hypothetical protein
MTVGMLGCSQSSKGWYQINVGGGGWVTGMDIAPDGTMVCRCDTFNAFKWNSSLNAWSGIVSLDTMPSNSVGLLTNGTTVNPGGPYEIKIAPSNSSVLYMHYNWLVYKSTNGGKTWTQTNFSSDFVSNLSGGSNDPFRYMQNKMAIDPIDPNVVLVGSPQTGLYITTDGGNTWTLNGVVPASLEHTEQATYPGHTGMCFDATHGSTGGRTNVAYCAVAGEGVYKTTTTAAGTWSLISGSPQFVSDAIAISGLYYCCCWDTWANAQGAGGAYNRPAYVWKYNGTSWSTLTTDNSNGYWSITINPSDSTNILVMSQNGNFSQTYNSGANWIQYANKTMDSSADVSWLQYCSSGFNSMGSIKFDPNVTHRLWVSQGLGVWYTDSVTSSSLSGSTSIAWKCQTRGIEQLVCASVTCPPGGSPVYGFWDQGTFTLTNLASKSFPTSPHNISTQFAAAWSLDYAKDDNKTIVAITQWSTPRDNSGYSSDGGLTWNAFVSKPWGTSFNGGAIAASTHLNFVYLPAPNTTAAYYTLDGGGTWSTGSGLPTTGWPSSYGAGQSRRLVCDGYTAGTFYLIHQTNGTYISTDGGATWTLQGASPHNSGTVYPFTKAVLGNAGHLFHAYGGGVNQPLQRSTNGGVTWSSVANTYSVSLVDLGGIAPGKSYPSIWMVGYYDPNGVYPSSTYGIWRSLDNCVTWTLITTYPFNHFDGINVFECDKLDYRRIFIGFSGSGAGYGVGL